MGEEAIKIAIVHDWLVTEGGAEKVLKELLELFPQSDLYTIVDFLDEKQRRNILGGKKTKTSFIQRLPFAKTHFRYYLPLMPKAIESFDFSGYDLVISSSWAFAKGAQAKKHICYCHTPIRYAWDLYDEYTKDLSQPKKWIVQKSLQIIRKWDRSRVPHTMVANSTEVQRRIKRIYNRSSIVIYPPIDTQKFTLCEKKENYYFTMSRLVPYKKTKLLVEAFNQMPHRHLIVAGEGEELETIKKIAASNVEVLGYVGDADAVRLMQNAKAFCYAAYEDFGIVMAEALACGTPVIAYGNGGALDIVDKNCGVLFKKQCTRAIIEAIEQFERSCFDPKLIRKRALKFDRLRFTNEFKRVVDEMV